MIRLVIFSLANFLAAATIAQTSSSGSAQSRDTVPHADQKPTPIIGITKVLEYPEAAKRAGIEGSVTVKFKVRRDCTVDSVAVVKSDNPMLDSAAIAAFKKCRYLPGRKNYELVETWMMEKVNFRLR